MRAVPLVGAALVVTACGTGKPTATARSGAAVGSSPRPTMSAPETSAATKASPPPDHSSGDMSVPGLPTRQGREERLVAHMLKRVERARGLDATHPVPGVLLDRTALIARVRAHVAQELPPEAIRNEGLELQLLGFIPTQFDYEAAEYRLLQDQLAGYYEPSDGTMYMADDLSADESEATLAHELVHALQDQHWNLLERSKYRPGQSDLSDAVSALAEGDATSAMFDVIIARAAPGSGKTALDLPEQVFSEQIRQGMNQGPAAEAPQIMRTSLAAPYIYGTLFVNALRRRGGWDAVDRAWEDAPATSEQIMHLDKWLAHEAAIFVTAPTFAALGSGWKVLDEDSEGELGTRVAFEEWMSPAAAADASAGWGGDRSVLLGDGDRSAFAWRLRYDPDATKDGRAAHAFSAVTSGVGKALGKPAARDASFECYERKDRGPFAVAKIDGDLVFIAGPATTRPGSGSWSSAGDCTLARKWLREIQHAR